jgi:hypothetical protein
LVEKGSIQTFDQLQIEQSRTAAMRNFALWKLIVYPNGDRINNPYFITVFGVSLACDRHNKPEVFTTETGNHARQCGGGVVEICE